MNDRENRDCDRAIFPNIQLILLKHGGTTILSVCSFLFTNEFTNSLNFSRKNFLKNNFNFHISIDFSKTISSSSHPFPLQFGLIDAIFAFSEKLFFVIVFLLLAT